MDIKLGLCEIAIQFIVRNRAPVKARGVVGITCDSKIFAAQCNLSKGNRDDTRF